MGTVYSFAIGSYFSTRVYTLLCTAPVLVALILILTVVPETPYFLMTKNRPRYEIAEVLAKLRSCSDLQEEMKQIESVVRKSSSGGHHTSIYLRLFSDRASRKAFAINSSMMIFNLASGVVVINSFLGPILDRVTATKWSGNTSAIAISLVRLVSTLIGSFVVERRAPFICIVLFTLADSFGLEPVPFAYMSEFFPQHVKNLGVPVCLAIGFLVSGLIALVFPYFMDYLGMQWCFWLFGTICVTCTIFTKYVVPDTDGKTLKEIQRLMEE
nr:unnamed protein product [Callosobruchus analis]